MYVLKTDKGLYVTTPPRDGFHRYAGTVSNHSRDVAKALKFGTITEIIALFRAAAAVDRSVQNLLTIHRIEPVFEQPVVPLMEDLGPVE